MASLVDLKIGGRVYPVACRDGEEDSLHAAARLVDSKVRDAIAGLGTLSESRQFLFAALLLADQLIEKSPEAAASVAPPDPALTLRAEAIAGRLEALAATLESENATA